MFFVILGIRFTEPDLVHVNDPGAEIPYHAVCNDVAQDGIVCLVDIHAFKLFQKLLAIHLCAGRKERRGISRTRTSGLARCAVFGQVRGGASRRGTGTAREFLPLTTLPTRCSPHCGRSSPRPHDRGAHRFEPRLTHQMKTDP